MKSQFFQSLHQRSRKQSHWSSIMSWRLMKSAKSTREIRRNCQKQRRRGSGLSTNFFWMDGHFGTQQGVRSEEVEGGSPQDSDEWEIGIFCFSQKRKQVEDKSWVAGDGGDLLCFQSGGAELCHWGNPGKGVEAVSSSHSIPSNTLFSRRNGHLQPTTMNKNTTTLE